MDDFAVLRQNTDLSRTATYTSKFFLWQLYADVIDAASKLGVDGDKIEEWKEVLSKLKPLEVGESNQILEWYHENELGSVGEKTSQARIASYGTLSLRADRRR